jgi:hypothetical protein
MIGKARVEKFIFPRVPIHMEVPVSLPDIGRLNSMAVVPTLDRCEVFDGEVEIWGGYNLKVFYKPAADNSESPVFSWELDKNFHTYAEFAGLKTGEKIQLQPAVEKVDLEVTTPRSVKGSLTVAVEMKRV